MQRRSFFGSVFAGLAVPAAHSAAMPAHTFTTGDGWLKSLQARSPSAVNYITLHGGGPPVISNVGAETNISPRRMLKGSGRYTFNS